MLTPDPVETGNFAIRHSSDLAAVRTELKRIGAAAGLTDVAIAEVAVAATELGQNIVVHGGGVGTIELHGGQDPAVLRLRVRDKGPGLDPAKITSSIRASAGRGGQGLSALARLMNVVELSFGTGGAEIACQKWSASSVGPRMPRVVALQRPHPREQVSGDGAFIQRDQDRLRIALTDGLGHGPAANRAAQVAHSAFALTMRSPVAQAIARAHEMLAATRGAALSLVDLDLAKGLLSVASIGNVRASMISEGGTRWSPVGIDSIAGHGRPGSGGQLNPRIETARWTHGNALILFTDGISSRLAFPQQLTMVRADPMVAALSLFQAHAGMTDDATLILVT
jgi:anti-sigma regulatory factor (Ser/Thr protein kinase)